MLTIHGSRCFWPPVPGLSASAPRSRIRPGLPLLDNPMWWCDYPRRIYGIGRIISYSTIYRDIDMIYLNIHPISILCVPLFIRPKPTRLVGPSEVSANMFRMGPTRSQSPKKSDEQHFAISTSYSWFTNICWLVVEPYPSEKWWSSSVGGTTFPIYGKS